MNWSRHVAARLVGLPIGVGVLMLGFGLADGEPEWADWPSTGGEVVRSEVEHRVDDHANFAYHPLVEYAYEVGGVPYTGRRITPRPVPSFQGEGARAIADRYPVEAVVTVHYDPSAPERALLDKRVEPRPAYLRYGITLLAAGLLLTLFVARR